MQPIRPPVGCTFHILHRDKSAGKGVSHVLGVFQKDCLADTSSALHHSRFLRAADNEYCRSTAILIGTSGKVRFINNKVNTRVGSIRIKDDPSIWYESGRTTNFLIENNVFFSLRRMVGRLLNSDTHSLHTAFCSVCSHTQKHPYFK